MRTVRNNKADKRVFIECNGPGPWPCDFCGEAVAAFGLKQGELHHRNGVKTDGSIENLGAAHPTCHRQHHTIGRTISPATRAKMSAAAKGRTNSIESRLKQSQTLKGCVRTAAHRRAISLGALRRDPSTYNRGVSASEASRRGWETRRAKKEQTSVINERKR